jgi:hypothetical protein
MNFRNLIPWTSSSDYQKISEDVYSAKQTITQEKSVSNSLGFTVGPNDNGGATIVFNNNGGFNTTVELSYIGVQKLMQLLEVAIDYPEETNDTPRE